MKNDWTERIDELEKENAELKETIKSLRWEGDEYQRKLDRIDELALLIESYIPKIIEFNRLIRKNI